MLQQQESQIVGRNFENTIRAVYERRNARELTGVIAAFTVLGPAGFAVEYVGETPLDDGAAIDDMLAN